MLTCNHNDMQQSTLLFNLACGAPQPDRKHFITSRLVVHTRRDRRISDRYKREGGCVIPGEILRGHGGGRGLSCLQRAWLKFCLMGVLMTNTMCWTAFERAGLRGYRFSALSWMFRHSKLDWERLW